MTSLKQISAETLVKGCRRLTCAEQCNVIMSAHETIDRRAGQVIVAKAMQ